MTTERAAALTGTAPAGVDVNPDLNPSDRPETDQSDARSVADQTAAVAMRHFPARPYVSRTPHVASVKTWPASANRKGAWS
jgi:hypothetical protein